MHNSCTCFLRALHGGREEAHRYARPCTRVTLHQLSLVDLSDPPLQLLRVLREELELGAVALRVLPWVVVPNFGWEDAEQDIFNFQEESLHFLQMSLAADTGSSAACCTQVDKHSKSLMQTSQGLGSHKICGFRKKKAETMGLDNQSKTAMGATVCTFYYANQR